MNGSFSTGCYLQKPFIQYKRKFYRENGLKNCAIACLAYHKGALYAGTQAGLYRFADETFIEIGETLSDKPVSLLRDVDGSLFAASGNELYILDGDEFLVLREFEEPVVDIAKRGEDFWVLTENRLYKTDASFTNDLLIRFTEGGRGRCMAVSDENFYVATEHNLSVIHGKRQEWKNIIPQFSDYPATAVHCAVIDEFGYLWLGTDAGVLIHDNKDLWLKPETIHTLPKNPVYGIATDGTGGRYYASDVGVICQKNGGMKYFSAARWVPDNRINDLFVSPDGNTIYAATDNGLAMIESFTSIFDEKARYYEDIIEKYHIRRGFTANGHTFTGELKDSVPTISDNDGLWTGCYVAAESLRYAVTGEREALEKARRGLNAMLLLTRITDIPGFTARAVRYEGDPGFGNGNKEWIRTADGTCEWKCETSSDEMTGHYFGMSLYYDLCADEKEKEEIRNALCGIMDHIVVHNYRMVDHDGLPTTWANWDPMLLNYDDKWFFERGINSLELLAFLTVCSHISDDIKYKALYEEFVRKYRYPLNVMQHKVRDAHGCHIDDNLGFLAAFTLLRLEEDKNLRALYLCGLEDHWQYERVERQPMFCIIHAAFTGRDDDLAEGVLSLREMPWDLTNVEEHNSLRRDLVYDTEQETWSEPPQVLSPLPYDERNLHRPDHGAFHLDCGPTGRVQEPTIYLLPYWIGRYYGLIGE